MLTEHANISKNSQLEVCARPRDWAVPGHSQLSISTNSISWAIISNIDAREEDTVPHGRSKSRDGSSV